MADVLSNDTLSPRQYKALAALLSETSIRRAGEVSGVPEKTIYNWLRQPDFDTAYREARREAMRQATARLQHASSAAVTVLCNLMVRETVNPAVRRAAARDILDLAYRAIELEDLDQRLKAIEERYATKL